MHGFGRSSSWAGESKSSLVTPTSWSRFRVGRVDGPVGVKTRTQAEVLIREESVMRAKKPFLAVVDLDPLYDRVFLLCFRSPSNNPKHFHLVRYKPKPGFEPLVCWLYRSVFALLMDALLVSIIVIINPRVCYQFLTLRDV